MFDTQFMRFVGFVWEIYLYLFGGLFGPYWS